MAYHGHGQQGYAYQQVSISDAGIVRVVDALPRQSYNQLPPPPQPQIMPDPFRPVTPGYTSPGSTDPLRHQPSPGPQAPMGYYPPPTASPPQMGYPTSQHHSFAQAGHQVMTGDQAGYPPQQPALLHHSHSQPLYDPSYPTSADIPQYDHFGGGPPITTLQPEGGIYMPDHRMTSPPPLIHQQSSDASFLYADGQAQPYYDPPTRGYSPYPNQTSGGGGGMPGGYGHIGDDMADEPLLARPSRGGSIAPPDTRYGNPFSGGTGDLGAVDDGSGDVGAAAAASGQGNEDEPVTLRYGAAPEGRMIRRLKTTKRVPYVFPFPSSSSFLCTFD